LYKSIKLTRFTVEQFLFAHGDHHRNLELTRRVLDELLTDFITEMCFEAHRSAQLAGRQKVKIDDIKFACRKNPQFLGKMEEVFSKKDYIDKARKAVDMSDDKIAKNAVKVMEEPLGDADDDVDLDDSKSTGTRARK
jgi:transcription initiation factor TFIID subunit 13